MWKMAWTHVENGVDAYVENCVDTYVENGVDPYVENDKTVYLLTLIIKQQQMHYYILFLF
jgi:hypothetical protein